MPNLFSKHLHLCFFKLKDPTILSQSQPQQHDHHHTPSPSPSPSPPSTKFHSNTTFNYYNHSLYDTTSSAHSTFKATDDYFSSSSSSSDDDSMDLPPPDFASIFASQRFFFSSPGSSNSIIESPDTRPRNSHNNNNNNTLIPRGGVRVPKYSLDPYVDFLRSMHEMIDSRQALDVRKDWDYLHELLLCYLALNPTHTHKYIVRAFTDIVVDLLSSTSPPSSIPCRMHKNRRQTSFSGRLV